MSADRPVLKGLLAAFALSFVVCLVLPAQSYAANADDFPFGWAHLLIMCLPVFACVFAALSALGVLAARCGQKWACVLMLAIAFAILMEVGLLSIGLPEVDGRMSAFKNDFRQCWDAAAWIVMIALPMFFCRFIYSRLAIIVPVFAIYAALTIVDFRSCKYFDGELSKSDGYLVDRMYQQDEVMASVRYSPKRNVFLLIIDSVSSDIASTVMRECPEIADKFDGFVDYERNVGMDWPTRPAIPAIFTGKLRGRSDNELSFGHAYLKTGSFLESYLKADCPVFMNLDIGFGGYTNRRVNAGEANRRQDDRMIGALAWSVGEVSLFRALPYVFKRHYLRYVTNYWETLRLDHWWSGDRRLWPALASCPEEKGWPCTLQVHHTWGVHLPIMHDRNGNPIGNSSDAPKRIIVNGASYVFGLVGQYFDALRRRGLYDSATIILIADHGICDGDLQPDGMPDEKAFPMLMVKPAGARGPLEFSEKRTSHAGIFSVMCELVSRDLGRDDIERLLVSAPHRIRHFERGKVMEWDL